MINIKRLIQDIGKGSHTLTPISSPNMDRVKSRSVDPAHRRIASNQPPTNSSFRNDSLGRKVTVSPGKKFMNMAEAIRLKSSIPSIALSLRNRTATMASRSSSNTGNDKSVGSSTGKGGFLDPRTSKPLESLIGNQVYTNPLDVSLIQAIFASLMTWGLDDNIDQMGINELSLINPGAHVVYGMRGYVIVEPRDLFD